LFKQGDRRVTNNYIGIGILNTCCKIYSKILYIKPQRYSNSLWQAQNGFSKGRSCSLLIVKQRECNLETYFSQIMKKSVWYYSKTDFIWYFYIQKYSRYIIKCNNGHMHTKQNLNLLAPELFFFNFSTPVYKMWIMREPNS